MRAAPSIGIAALLLCAFSGCSGGAEPATSTGTATPAAPVAVAVTRHPGLAARTLGAEVTLSPADQTAANALVATGMRLSGAQEYGASLAYFVGGGATEAPALQLQQQMLWLARSSTDTKVVVAAVTRLGALGSSGTDWPVPQKELLMGLIAHADPHVASAATCATERNLRGDADVSALIREAALKHAHPVVRAQACRALERRATSLTDDGPSLAALVSAVDDEAPIVALAALSALGAALWSSHLPADTYAKLLGAARSPVALVRAAGIADLASFVSGQQTATAQQRAETTALMVAAFDDPDPWVRAQMFELIDLVRGRAAHFDAIVAKLDDGALLAPSMPYEKLALEPSTAPEAFAMAVSSGYEPNTVGNYALRAMFNYARQGDSGRIPAESRLTTPGDVPPVEARAALLAWWAANREAAIAAGQRP